MATNIRERAFDRPIGGTLAAYVEEVQKIGDDPYYDMERRQYPHVRLYQTSAMPQCGCDVVGHGVIPSPIAIRFCPVHAQAPAMLSEIRTTMDDLNTAIDHLGRWTAEEIVNHLTGVQRRQRALLRAVD